jgi:hypothetical protein
VTLLTLVSRNVRLVCDFDVAESAAREAHVMPMRSEITISASRGTTRPQYSRAAVAWSDFALVSAVSILGFLAALLLAVATHHLDPTYIAAVPPLGP